MTVYVSGIKETQKALREFSDKLADVITKKSLRAGANYMRAKIRADVPVQSGRMKRSIAVRASRINTRRKNGKIGFYLTYRKGKNRKDRNGAYYAKWVDVGYKFRSKSGKFVKEVPGKHIMRRNFYRHGSTAARLIMESINTSGRTILTQLKNRR